MPGIMLSPIFLDCALENTFPCSDPGMTCVFCLLKPEIPHFLLDNDSGWNMISKIAMKSPNAMEEHHG